MSVMPRARAGCSTVKAPYRFECKRTFRGFLPKDGTQLWGKLGPDAVQGAFYSAMIFEGYDDAAYYDVNNDIREAEVTVRWSIERRLTVKSALWVLNTMAALGIECLVSVLGPDGSWTRFREDLDGRKQS